AADAVVALVRPRALAATVVAHGAYALRGAGAAGAAAQEVGVAGLAAAFVRADDGLERVPVARVERRPCAVIVCRRAAAGSGARPRDRAARARPSARSRRVAAVPVRAHVARQAVCGRRTRVERRADVVAVRVREVRAAESRGTV